MLDLPDPILDEPAAPLSLPPRPTPTSVASPLRAWGMWGGWSALGVVCAASLAHAAARLGRALEGQPAR
jgi:hypothetical protein